MFKKIITAFIHVVLLLACTKSFAILDLELTQGVAASIPIAIVTFNGPKILAQGDQSITDILQNDLQHSGEFRVLSRSDAGTDSEGIKPEEKLSVLRQEGADYVVTGKIEKTK